MPGSLMNAGFCDGWPPCDLTPAFVAESLESFFVVLVDTNLGGPHYKAYNILGSILGPLNLGKTQEHLATHLA